MLITSARAAAAQASSSMHAHDGPGHSRISWFASSLRLLSIRRAAW